MNVGNVQKKTKKKHGRRTVNETDTVVHNCTRLDTKSKDAPIGEEALEQNPTRVEEQRPGGGL